MSLEHPGDDKRCDWCDRPGVPYTYRGRRLSGLCPYKGDRLCPSCRDRALEQDTPKVEDIPVVVIAANYRPEYADHRPRRRRGRRAS